MICQRFFEGLNYSISCIALRDLFSDSYIELVAMPWYTKDRFDIAYTSAVVLEELEKAPPEKYEKMAGLIQKYDISILALSDEADRLTDVYVAEGIIPQKYRTDGLHIALATVNDLDMIVSMNFQHIVKRKTILATGKINNLNGYRTVEIYSPMEVIENEND